MTETTNIKIKKKTEKHRRKLQSLGWNCCVMQEHEAGSILSLRYDDTDITVFGTSFLLHAKEITNLFSGRGELLDEYLSTRIELRVFFKNTSTPARSLTYRERISTLNLLDELREQHLLSAS